MCSRSTDQLDSSITIATDFSHILSYSGLCDALLAASKSNKGIVFIEGKDKEFRLSYADLYTEARRIAQHLTLQQVPSNAEIIIQAADTHSFVPLFWGCLIGGFKPIPLSLGFTDDHRLKLLHVWELLEHPWLLHNATDSFFQLLNQTASEHDLESRVEAIESRYTIYRGDESCEPMEHLPEYSQDDIVFIQFSSGSTGKPKGVSISNRNILDNIYYTTRLQKFEKDDIFFNWMPLTHDMGLIYYHIQGVVLQMDQCQMPTQLFIRYPSLWMHKMSEHRASHSASPNFGYRFFLDYYNKEMSASWDLSCIKYLLNAAEPISLKIYEKFASEMEPLGLRRSSLHAGYGLAEATLVVSMREPGLGMESVSLDRNKLSVGTSVSVIDADHPDALPFALCGTCIESVEVRFTDDAGMVLEDGHIGNLEMYGISVVDGYYRNPEATDAALTADGWFKTGDLGFRWNGEIVITGRTKEIIFVGGLNYYPHDIEAALHDVEGLGLNKIIATGIQNPESGAEELVLFAYYKAKLEAFPTLVNRIKDTLLQRMGLIAHVIIPIKQVPKTTSGKLRRVYLAEQYKSGAYDTLLIETGQQPFCDTSAPKLATPVAQGSISESTAKTPPETQLSQTLIALLKRLTGLDAIPTDARFDELGINSMKAVQFHEQLEGATGLKLPISIAFDYPSIQELAAYLNEKSDRITISESQIVSTKSDDIAIVGVSFQLPGSISTMESLWNHFTNGDPSVRPYPKNRPNAHEWESVPEHLKLAHYLEDLTGFDAPFFGITSDEASAMDPQQRLLLESAYHAFEDAGLTIDSIRERNIGVYTGISSSEYRKYVDSADHKGPYDITGNLTSTAAGRISYIFGLRGPAMSIDTACSSSLVALHQACTALRSGETEIALVSAVNLILDVHGTLGLHAVQALSNDGLCKAFDESANGYGRAEGVVSFIVKPLSSALEHGDTVYAVIKATTINHDGRSNGLTAPSGKAQMELITRNLQKAAISPDQLIAIETHGTGTNLGDPQELGAWMDVFDSNIPAVKPCISATKAQLGHLESAAGLAGVLKSILMIQKGVIPAHRLSSVPTSLLDWETAPFKLPLRAETVSQKPEDRFVCVSSFGLSGTNAHIVLTGFNAEKPSVGVDHIIPSSALVLSARSESALRELAMDWMEYLDSSTDSDYTSALSAQVYRNNDYAFRMSVSGRSRSELTNALRNRLEQPVVGAPYFRTSVSMGWLFTGQGSQYPAMFKSLYESSILFRTYIAECQSHLDAIKADIDLETFILQGDERIHLTRFTQPVLAALELSLTKMLGASGLKADVVCGHSLGEIVALCYAGVIQESDMFTLLVRRGALMSGVSQKGGMMVAFSNLIKLKEVLTKYSLVLDIASINTSESVTLSGHKDVIEATYTALNQEGIRSKMLTVETAFHSSLMDEILTEFNQTASKITYHPAKIPVILNINGSILNPGETIDASYLTRQIREAVQFRECMVSLATLQPSVLVEVGPSAALSPMAAAAGVSNNLFCVSDTNYDSYTAWLQVLGGLYELGVGIDFRPFVSPAKSATHLPSYPFQHTSYWINTKTSMSPTNTSNNSVLDSNTISINWPSRIKQLVAESTGFSQDQLHESVNLFELGLDSLVLLKVKAALKEAFNVEVAASQFFNEANTIDKIAGIVQKQVAEQPVGQQVPLATEVTESPNQGSIVVPSSVVQTSSEGVKRLIDEQIRLMHRQLDVLQGVQTVSGSSGNGTQSNGIERSVAVDGRVPSSVSAVAPSGQKTSYVAYKSVKNAQSIAQIPKEGLQKLIDTYTKMTAASKNEVASHRKWLATSRNIAGFRPDRKEMVYQIHIDRAQGAYVHDVDGNRLLDITMGFGVSLFGNKPDFIEQAMLDELQRGIGVGAMSYRAGRVARKFCELTGHQRVAFFNSGSEAVMNAIRVARTYRKRTLVVQFSGAYHGNSDPILGVSVQKEGRSGAMPMSPGMPESYFADHIVLDYDNPDSLHEIASRANEIAAVIVEPVQSRKPELQPKAFLTDLRALTEKHGIVLIFDETITGLRVGKHGAQGFFGIKADIATYGKIVGGGLPIGLVAGKSEVMDAVDGGIWNYGDQSYPEAENTFSAGTFNHHPLVLATMEAVLDKIDAQGDVLYPQLEQRTHRLVSTLNDYFKRYDFPVSLVHFGSLFRFNVTGPGELLFYKLVTKGVYIWEGRNCFISTAHTDDDIDFLINAVIDAVREMREDGFFPDGGSSGDTEAGGTNGTGMGRTVDQHPIQQRMFALSNLELGEEAYQIRGAMKILGDFDLKKFVQVCDGIFRSNDAFSTSFSVSHGKLVQTVDNQRVPAVEYVEVDAQTIQGHIEHAIRPFDVNDWPLVRITVLKTQDREHILIVNAHHIVLDGYSLSVFFEQFLTAYFDGTPELGTLRYSDFVAWQKEYESSPKFKEDQAFWLNVLDNYPKPVIPAANKVTDRFSFDGSRLTHRIPIEDIRSTARRLGVSVYSLVFGVYALFVHRSEGLNDFMIGSVTAGRPDGYQKTMGMFVNTIPFRFVIQEKESVTSFIQHVSATILRQLESSFYPYHLLLNQVKVEREAGTNPFFETIFSYEKDTQRTVSVGGMTFETYDLPRKASGFPLLFDVIETQDELIIGIEFQFNHYDRSRVEQIAAAYSSMLTTETYFDQATIADIQVPSFEKKATSVSNVAHTAEIVSRISSTPRNGTLRAQIAKIWSEVLSIEQVDYDTSFFWLGGDSIKAIQIVSRLSDLGFKTRINTIFKHPTIHKLASAIESSEPGALIVNSTDTFGLLPIHSYFFELQLAHASFWNQAIRLSTSQLISDADLKKTFEILIARHPLLAARVSADSFDTSQIVPDQSIVWEVVEDTTESSMETWIQDMEQRFVVLQQQQDLGSGKLMSVLVGRFNHELHLFWSVHHLVTDAVSWQLLVHDFNEIYTCLRLNKEIALPPVQDHISRWTLLSETFRKLTNQEGRFWKSMTSDKGTTALVSTPCSIGELKTQSIRLSDRTASMLDALIIEKGTRFAEAALMGAIYSVLHGGVNQTCWFWNEYHGRRYQDFEISQALGWFTSLYPVKVSLSEESPLSVQLYETLNSVPNHGFGYGYQGHLMGDTSFDRRPQVRFNFLGEFPSTFDGFNVHLIDNKLTMHSENRHDVALDVNTIKLSGAWIIQLDMHPEVDLSAINTLEELLSHEIATMSGYNPEPEKVYSFFYDQQLPEEGSRVEFAQSKKLVGSEITLLDCYPLSPLQQGLLYHAQLKANIQSGLQQLVIQLDGHLDVAQLQHAISVVCRRHAPLRTQFSSKLEEPVQIVVDAVPDFSVLDLRYESIAEYDNRIAGIKQADVHTPFALFDQVPVRFQYVIGPENRSVLFFTIHHIVYDGWSNDILLRELTSVYNGYELESITGRWATVAVESAIKARRLTESYWHPYLQDQPEMSPLKWARSAEPNLVDSSENSDVVIKTDPLEVLQNQVKSLNASVNTLIQAAWGTTLLVLGSHESVTMGCVFSGRYGLSVEVDDHVGLFISTVPFKVTYNAQQTVAELIESVHQSMVMHQENAFVSLPELSSELGVQEVFDSILVIENYPLNADLYPFRNAEGSQVTITEYAFHSEESVPLTVCVNYHPQFSIDIRFDPRQFTSSSTRKIAETFECILKTMAESAHQTMFDVQAAWKRTQSDKLKSKSLGKILSLKNK
jgi:iturin family lipopeptide synthetase A